MALAGPLTNFILAFIGFAALVAVNPPDGSLASMIMSVFVIVNLGFFVFNMLPIPPLDGSRVLYALAPEFVRTGMRAIEQFGIIFILILVLLAGSLLGSYMSEAINFFLLLFQTIFRV